MRRHLHLCAALVAGITCTVLFVSAGTAKANLLSNGNLDLTHPVEVVPGFFLPQPDDWVNDGSRTLSGPFLDGMSSEPWAGPAPTPTTGAPVTNDGDFGVFFKPFTGNATTGDLTTVHFYQDVAGTAGTRYYLDGWAGAEAGYSGLLPGSGTQSIMAIDFLNGANAVIGSVQLDLAAAGLGVVNGQPFNYKNYGLNGIAPAGTVTVRSRVSMINAFNNTGGQAFVIDDFNLAVPEPTGLGLLSIAGLALVARRRQS